MRIVGLISICLVIFGCNSPGPLVFRLSARPTQPTIPIEPGEHRLGLGGYRLVNFSLIWRDGLLYIPQAAKAGKPIQLLIWLHGGGGNAASFRYLFPIAEEFGVVILVLDARDNTWDGIDSRFGHDVIFIDTALKHVFERVAIDPEKIAFGGISDGASYALAIGRVNGDLFSHLIAVASGYINPPSRPVGHPLILVAHGNRDNVYGVWSSREIIVPNLRKNGYDVTYIEFDGPHWLPEPAARELLGWLCRTGKSSEQQR